MSDAQLLSCFNRLEKILNETKIYTKLMNINKDGLPQNYYDEDELLFPLEIGHEMYNKTLKVYLESKAFIEGIEKSLNKCIDKIGKNEKGSQLINPNNNNSSGNSNSKFNSNSSNSSSSSDEETPSKVDQIGQKRKSKSKVAAGSKLNKRVKPDSKEDNIPNATTATTTTTTTTTSTSATTKDSHKSEKSDKEGKAEKADKENGGTPSKEKSTQSTTPSKDNGSSNSNGTSNNNQSQIQPGQLVAARDTKQQWILAKVNSYSPKTQKYEVIDEDEDEPKRFSVGPKDILQLPSPSNLPAIPIQTKVLAMFPDTTAFYPAVVVNVQKVKGKPTHYHLHFEDDQENGETPNRRVSAQHVILTTK